MLHWCSSFMIFQSTLPREERHGAVRVLDHALGISIHAPTRGATASPSTIAVTIRDFNPRSHERSDPGRVALDSYVIFQSTLPREERRWTTRSTSSSTRNFNPRSHERSDQAVASTVMDKINFNPRSHERSDMQGTRKADIDVIFQSTLPREERRLPQPSCTSVMVFQSTLPREERRIWTPVGTSPSLISIHAPTRGATPLDQPGDGIDEISIHAPTRGATLMAASASASTLGFQSTLPREERQQYCTKNLFIFIQYRQ